MPAARTSINTVICRSASCSRRADQWTNPFQFAGNQLVQTDAPDLFGMGVREYSPSAGRFLSTDPLQIVGGNWNLYTYAYNQPLQFVDPSGLKPTIRTRANRGRSPTAFRSSRRRRSMTRSAAHRRSRPTVSPRSRPAIMNPRKLALRAVR